MNKIINITHTDKDGDDCGIICKLYAESQNAKFELYNCSYRTVDATVTKILQSYIAETLSLDGLEIYITDISISAPSALDAVLLLKEKHPEVKLMLFDHHESATWLNKYDFAYVAESIDGTKHCGTYLIWKHLCDARHCKVLQRPKIKQFVYLTDLWDTWRWKTEGDLGEFARRLNLIHSIKPQDAYITDTCTKLLEPMTSSNEALDNSYLTPVDIELLKSKELELENLSTTLAKQLTAQEYNIHIRTSKMLKEIQQYVYKTFGKASSEYKQARRLQLGSSYKILLSTCFVSGDISEIADRVLSKRPDIDVLCLVNLPCNASLRTTKNLLIPLGFLAEYLGYGKGGGHPQSAGFVIPKTTVSSIVDKLLRR